MKKNEIKQLTDAELDSQINELRRERLNLAIQSKSGQLTKPHRVREVRRTIARIETEKTARSNAKVNG